MDRLANPSIHTVSNNIVDTSYTRFIIIERDIYLTMLWTTKHINGHCF